MNKILNISNTKRILPHDNVSQWIKYWLQITLPDPLLPSSPLKEWPIFIVSDAKCFDLFRITKFSFQVSGTYLRTWFRNANQWYPKTSCVWGFDTKSVRAWRRSPLNTIFFWFLEQINIFAPTLLRTRSKCKINVFRADTSLNEIGAELNFSLNLLSPRNLKWKFCWTIFF